jgi:methylated-DNA-[protein]-cysteine S-methyltransferase
MKEENLYYDYMDSPVGELEISAGENALLSVLFSKTKDHELPRKEINSNPIIEKTKQQLESYFKNEISEFNLPIKPKGTEFQTKVWRELCNIPHGKTISYLSLAKKLGDVKSIRAAASANGKNPLAIIVPCHRVIGTTGKLVGYSGDLWRKQWLLEHELKKSGALLTLFS